MAWREHRLHGTGRRCFASIASGKCFPPWFRAAECANLRRNCSAALLACDRPRFVQSGKDYFKYDSIQLCQRLNSMMEFYIKSGRLAGAVCDVRLDGNVLYQSARGCLNVEQSIAAQTNSIFKIFSMTKPVTAVAILQLDDKGLIDLDDPVHKYLPMFNDLRVTRGGSMDAADWKPLQKDVTLRHLLLHTSGFTYSFLGNSDLQKRYEMESIHSLGPGNPPNSLLEVMQRLSKLPLQHQPGVQWSYGVNYDVLGAVIEAVSGERLGDYLRKALFEPLSMVDTGFSGSVRGKEHRVATSYTLAQDGGGIAPVGRQAYTRDCIHYGGGGLYSTADDYQNFCAMLLSGGVFEGNEILSPKALRLMMSPQLASSIPVRGGMILSFRRYKGYSPSAGGAVLVDPGTSGALGHEGEFMWEGSESSHFWVDTRTGLSALWLCQLRPLNTYPLLRHLKRAVYAPSEGPQCDESWWTAEA